VNAAVSRCQSSRASQFSLITIGMATLKVCARFKRGVGGAVLAAKGRQFRCHFELDRFNY
jgi:hypothetical protein